MSETKILYLARVNVTEPKEVLNIGFLSHFPFPKTLFPSFLHHHCLQFLYPINFLVRECFSLLVTNLKDRSAKPISVLELFQNIYAMIDRNDQRRYSIGPNYGYNNNIKYGYLRRFPEFSLS